jgi:NADH-quinone oxidoreductase subunit M
MNLQQLPLISIVLFFPLVGAVILLFVKKEDTELIKRFTLVWTILTFVLSLGFVIGFRYADPGFQFYESLPWIPQLGIGYQVGLDGISLLLIILTTD